MALNQLEDYMFSITKKYPDAGTTAFGLLSRAMEYREVKLENAYHRLPPTLRLFIIFGTSTVILSSLLIPFVSLILNYFLALIFAVIAFAMYLLIDDFDHPYRKTNRNLTIQIYEELLNEVKVDFV